MNFVWCAKVLTPVWFLVGWCLLRLEMNRRKKHNWGSLRVLGKPVRPVVTSVRERRDRPEAWIPQSLVAGTDLPHFCIEARGWNFH